MLKRLQGIIQGYQHLALDFDKFITVEVNTRVGDVIMHA